jgi:hypothetical protein
MKVFLLDENLESDAIFRTKAASRSRSAVFGLHFLCQRAKGFPVSMVAFLGSQKSAQRDPTPIWVCGPPLVPPSSPRHVPKRPLFLAGA